VNQNSDCEEVVVESASTVLYMLVDLFKKKPLQLLMGMLFFVRGVNILWFTVGEVYLTNDLHLPKDYIASFKLLAVPFGTLSTIYLGKVIQVDPYKALMYTMYLMIAFVSYVVFYFCATFPKDETPSLQTIIHACVMIILTEVLKTANLTAFFAVIFKVADKRMAAFHVTLLAALYNLSYTLHKLYIYHLLEFVGLYWCQTFLVTMAITFLLLFRDQVYAL